MADREKAASTVEKVGEGGGDYAHGVWRVAMSCVVGRPFFYNTVTKLGAPLSTSSVLALISAPLETHVRSNMAEEPDQSPGVVVHGLTDSEW